MNSRKSAITEISKRPKPMDHSHVPYDIENEYGRDVFGVKAMELYLPRDAYTKLLATISAGTPIDPSIADDVAHAMKKWAMERGATHYSHWFLPLTGSSAEKHDSFIDPDKTIGNAIARFSGKNLIMGEPDASSFPSGGLRSTFEARGYTTWDPTSPAFIKRSGGEATLCIPTAFCSYTGEVLDKKTPILRSMQVLGTQAKRLLKCFGVDVNKKFSVTLGAEQEYFLIDKLFYLLRPDLMQTGRTIFGAPPPKHQQLEDHYFGAIKPRILNFMSDVDRELWRMGIPSKTRHNEVAPAQFELAPVFEELNVAVDHNTVSMEVLQEIADKHGFVCLLHEKPFAGVNGSGKHNNWSMSLGDLNLLNPGNDPHQNAIFITTLCAIIKAVDVHSDLLRAASASAGNDHRLGANEAPPAIISIFLGDQLTDIIQQLENGDIKSSKKGRQLKVGVDTLPPLPCDVTDRNRTSPFAFTGNKFEYRAIGASQSCATPNILLNTIVAEAMDDIASYLETLSPKDFNEGLQKKLREIIKKHKRVIFNGDGYDGAWIKEAEARGLRNLKKTPEALKPLIDPKNVALFEKYGVFTKSEMRSRYEVFKEEYERKVNIEAQLAANIAKTTILPAVTDHLADMAPALVFKNKEIANSAKEISTRTSELIKAISLLEKEMQKHADEAKIISAMENLRSVVDTLEGLVDDRLWPLPKYSELLFIY